MNQNRIIIIVVVVIVALVLQKIYRDTQEIQEISQTIQQTETPPPVSSTTPRVGVGSTESLLQPKEQKVEVDDGSMNSAKFARRLEEFGVRVGYIAGKNIKAWEIKSPKGVFFYGKIETRNIGGESFSIFIGNTGTTDEIIALAKARNRDLKNFEIINKPPDAGIKFDNQKMFMYDYLGYNYVGVAGNIPGNRRPMLLSIGQAGIKQERDDVYGTITFTR